MRDVHLNRLWKEGQPTEEFGGDVNLKNKFFIQTIDEDKG